MIKLLDLVKPKPLTECVVATIHLNGQTLLAKNRDRKYNPTIKVIHELIDGTEVMYIYDELTGWSEGMNEYGIGIVNASLMVNFDEMQGDLAKDADKKGVVPSYDGLKIRKALSHNKLSEAIESIVKYVGEDKKDVGVKGMTMVANPKHAFVIELTSEHLPVIKKIDKAPVTVRTNHGIAYPNTGYISGVKRESSISRKEIATKQLEKVTEPEQVLDVLAKQWVPDNYMNPYRRENKFDMHTTGQVMMNLDELQFNFRWDVNHSTFEGYVSRLPKGYKPRIELIILEGIQ